MPLFILYRSNIHKGGEYYEEYQERKRGYKKRLRALKNIKRKIVRSLYYGLVNYAQSIMESEQNREVTYTYSES